jgi:hypothetical protein
MIEEDSDFSRNIGYHSIPVHATNNKFLRFLANNVFEPISMFFLKLYMRWGTTHKMDWGKYMEDNNEILERLGSDYDENGVPYWEKSKMVWSGSYDEDGNELMMDANKYLGVNTDDDWDYID